MTACDVGQGDAVVVRVGPAAALVVDAGPDPTTVDSCLDRLEVTTVPLVVLTHFHADHVDGLAGVLDDREVGRIAVTPVRDPPGAAAAVDRTASAAGVPVTPVVQGESVAVGEASVQVLWPAPDAPPTANDASVVLLVQVAEVSVLLTGDVEPPAQAAIRRTWPDLRADVLKVPHHGSRYQDGGWLTGLGADVVLVSSGEGNDYGHPAPETLELLGRTGARVLRTDTAGDVVVTVHDGTLATTSAG